jgi:hypothetical protein
MMSGIPSSRLLFGDLLRTGTFGLRTRRARAALSAVGIAIGIAAIVAVLGISRSSQAGLLDQLDKLGTNLLQVQAGTTFGGGTSELPTTSERMVGRIGPVQQVSSVASIDATVLRNRFVDPGETGGIQVKAARSDLLSVLEGTMTSGSFLNDATGNYPVTVLGAVAAQRLGFTELRPDTAVWLGGKLFRVAGVMAPLPLAPDIDRSALIGYGEAATDYANDGAPTGRDRRHRRRAARRSRHRHLRHHPGRPDRRTADRHPGRRRRLGPGRRDRRPVPGDAGGAAGADGGAAIRLSRRAIGSDRGSAEPGSDPEIATSGV